MSPASAVVDTVVLRYFLLVDQTALLINLLGRPLGVPRVVFDPDEGAVPPEAMSEMTRAIYDQRRRYEDLRQPNDVRTAANKRMQRLHAIHSLYGIGSIETLDMTETETNVFASLMSRAGAAAADLMFPLAAGEAAAVAIAIGRGLVCATDDSDALHALGVLEPGAAYERIRRLLIRAADEGLVSRNDANDIHAAMVNVGFWDKGRPFEN